MEVGVIVICITVGALICFALFGIGVICGRYDKEQPNRDSDIRIYIPMRHRNRGDNKNINPPTFEEKIMVLDTLRVGSSAFEQRIIDSIQEDLTNERNKMDSRREEASQN